MRIDDNTEHDLGTFQSFDVSQDDREKEVVPESIEGSEELDEESQSENWSKFSMSIMSSKARFALYSAAAVVALLIVIDLSVSVYQVWQIHWSLGILLVVASVSMICFSGLAIIQWIRGKDGIEVVHELQARAKSLRNSTVTHETQTLFTQLQDYYLNTPLEAQCKLVIDQLPDYLSDKERIDQFESTFLVPIDRRVEKIIQRYSLQTAVAVGFSPLPAVDALLTLWRTSMMINEVARTYGVKPTLANRLRVLARVTRTVAYAGLSQGGLDAVDVSGLPYVNIGAKALQGFGAGLATARVGHYTAIACRPISIEDDERLFDRFLSALKLMIGKRIFLQKDPE